VKTKIILRDKGKMEKNREYFAVFRSIIFFTELLFQMGLL